MGGKSLRAGLTTSDRPGNVRWASEGRRAKLGH